MRSKILRCSACKAYTLKEICPKCGAQSGTTRPARYSPEDRYGKYRRALAQEAK
ncbi:MAG: RNA-protein complex protein Nop10 [Methanosarcinales archaeon]|nr:RNA-protein complex protein Nop10 [Methanosarcinales archaeon]